MTLYEKITELRKRKGLSQEEFGSELGVSRQAVSKWEMAQTTPDINKIMAMAEFFGVSTDFLLKEEYDLTYLENGGIQDANRNLQDLAAYDPEIFIGIEEIQDYMKYKKLAAKNYVIAVFMFFISPFTGLILTLFSDSIAVIGAVVQIIILTISAVIIVITIWKGNGFAFLKRESAELAYGVKGTIEKLKEDFSHTQLMGIIIGVICIIGSIIPMMILSAFTSDNDIAIVICGCAMLLIFSAGLSAILYVQTIAHGYKRVLKMK